MVGLPGYTTHFYGRLQGNTWLKFSPWNIWVISTLMWKMKCTSITMRPNKKHLCHRENAGFSWDGTLSNQPIYTLYYTGYLLGPISPFKGLLAWGVKQLGGDWHPRKHLLVLCLVWGFCMLLVFMNLISYQRLGGGFKYFLFFTPIWGRFPFWLIFFNGVETTN